MSEARRGIRLFSSGFLEPRDETEERLEKCHRDLGALTTRLRENEVYNQLSEKVSRSPQEHEEITLALLYAILTDPSTASKSYHTLNLITRDSMGLVVVMVERIVMEKMLKLQDTTRMQLLWLTREMVHTGVAGADRVCFALLKHMPAGATSSGDVYVAEFLLNILLDNREWLESQPPLVDSVLFSYLAVIPGHMASSLSSLRDQEVQFCISLIRSKFSDIMSIGRDLLRLLQGVARIPEFTELWRDMLQHPQNLSPQLTDVHQLLGRRTSRRFVTGRVLPEVEIKLNFLLSKVKFGQQKRYQDWFQKKYLSSAESLLQVPELIRFICCVIHPPNEILQSDIVPRWALIGWLMTLCQANPVVMANAKLALFYDWLAYNPEVDNIMNIEPGILLMTHSLKQHPQLSAMLLEFLCKLIPTFCPRLESVIRTGVVAAFKDILQKEVILSVEPLFESSRLDEDLKSLVRRTFPELTQQAAQPDPAPMSLPPPLPPPHPPSGAALRLHDGPGSSADEPLVISSSREEEEDVQGVDQEVISAFSDSEGEGGGVIGGGVSASPPPGSQGFVAILEGSAAQGDMAREEEMEEDQEEGEEEEEGEEGEEGEGEGDGLSELPEVIRERLISLQQESDNTIQLTLLDDVLQMLDESDSIESHLPVVARVCAECLAEDFSRGYRSDDGSTEDNERPTLFLCRRSAEGQPALSLLASLRAHQPNAGYFFLLYLLNNARGKLSQYKDFVASCSGDLTIQSALVRDLKTCVENESSVFYDALPLLYKEFGQEVKQCGELLNLIVAHIDPIQLHSVMQKLMLRDFFIFGKEKVCIENLINKSLQWDSFEQFCVWQLLSAEGPDCSLVIPLIGKLDPEEHREALSGAILFLRAESAGVMGIWELLLMPLQHASLVDGVGSRWINAKPGKYAKYIAHFLDKCEKDMLPVSLTHLQRLMEHLNGNQLFEAADCTVAKALSKQFSSNKEYKERFPLLCEVVSCIMEPEKKEETSAKRPSGDRQESRPKKRRVINMDELTDS